MVNSGMVASGRTAVLAMRNPWFVRLDGRGLCLLWRRSEDNCGENELLDYGQGVGCLASGPKLVHAIEPLTA